MEKEKTIDVLNTLITINNDRIEGYETASKETNEQDLKNLFAQFTRTSLKCKHELVNEANKLGGTATEGTKITGKFFRVWMDVKAALTGNNRQLILDSCEYGESKAVDTYENVLKNDSEHLSAAQQRMISIQLESIKADHETVRSMHEELIVD
ncbi:MAG: PA2169 family four-helix-bundle protein [Saprospiraceae bacterium]|nr:PA2169 family four-helix-bundle protein [Saprospiraceae bacterium]